MTSTDPPHFLPMSEPCHNTVTIITSIIVSLHARTIFCLSLSLFFPLISDHTLSASVSVSNYLSNMYAYMEISLLSLSPAVSVIVSVSVFVIHTLSHTHSPFRYFLSLFFSFEDDVGRTNPSWKLTWRTDEQCDKLKTGDNNGEDVGQ